MTRSLLFAVLAIALAGCDRKPPARTDAPAPTKPGRKCPDLDLRDKNDPCSPMYLHRQKPRFKRDTL